MFEKRATRNTLLAVAFVLLGVGLFQSLQRSGSSEYKLYRQIPPPETLLLRSLAAQQVGAFAGTGPDIQDGVFYRQSVTYLGKVHPRAGEFGYCGRISKGNLPGFHYNYSSFVASTWLSFDGAPLPDSGDENSFALLDNPDDASIHARFVQTAAEVCRNGVLPEPAASAKQPPNPVRK